MAAVPSTGAALDVDAIDLERTTEPSDSSDSELVTVNVGGVKFQTTVGTLTAERGGLFAALLSAAPGRRQQQQEEQKEEQEQQQQQQQHVARELFIDRDGEQFRSVHN